MMNRKPIKRAPYWTVRYQSDKGTTDYGNFATRKDVLDALIYTPFQFPADEIGRVILITPVP